MSFRILCDNWKDGSIAISGLIWISHIQKFIIFVMVLINWSHTCWCLWNYIIHKKEQCVFRIQVYSFSEKAGKNQSILISTISTSNNRKISRSWNDNIGIANALQKLISIQSINLIPDQEVKLSNCQFWRHKVLFLINIGDFGCL